MSEVLLVQFFWFFGLHGQIIVNSVFDPIWFALNDQNLKAFQAGEELPNIITKQFTRHLPRRHGGGDDPGHHRPDLPHRAQPADQGAGQIRGAPGPFQRQRADHLRPADHHEPLVLIPWLLAPVVVTIITYAAMSIGLVPKPAGVIVPWTTPIGLSGFLATGNSWQGAVMQIFNLFVVMAIWWPFLKILDKQYYEGRKEIQAAVKPRKKPQFETDHGSDSANG